MTSRLVAWLRSSRDRAAPFDWDRSVLALDERLLGYADAVDESTVVVTTHHLWWPAASAVAGEWRAVPWHLVGKATWQDGWLSVTEVEVVDDTWLVDQAPQRLRLSEPRNVPQEVRRRVEQSVVRSEEAALERGKVRFVARKVRGRDGVSWWARLEGGATESPAVVSAVTARLERLRGRS